MSSTPLPPPSKYIDAVRESCKALRLAHGIKISEAGIRRLLLSPAFTSTYQRISSTSHGLALPLQFPSLLAELNFLSVLSLLNVASGYRVLLHQETGRGAWDSIRAFAFGLYLTSTSGEADLLSAHGMKNIHEGQIAELLGVKMHQERPHESISGLTIGEVGGQGYELVQIIKQLLSETGKILVNNGYRDLGSFVAEALVEGQRAAKLDGDDAAAEIVLEHLVNAFPGFQDMATIDGEPVYCFKKALFLLNGVSIRFASLSSTPFPIPKTSHLPICTDNVIPSLLIHLGVVDLSACDHSLASLFPSAGTPEVLENLLALATPQEKDATKSPHKAVPKEGPILTEAQAYILRAAAVDACEIIVRIAQSLDRAEIHDAGANLEWLSEITLPDLDTWLWAVAKDRLDYRQLDRFALRNTLYF